MTGQSTYIIIGNNVGKTNTGILYYCSPQKAKKTLAESFGTGFHKQSGNIVSVSIKSTFKRNLRCTNRSPGL